METDKILTVLRELHNITGSRVSLHDADFAEIAAYPEKRLPFCEKINSIDAEHRLCLECDRAAFEKATQRCESVIYKCRFGLTESISPLYNFGELTGFLMMGQIADTEADAENAKRCAEDTHCELCGIISEDIPTIAVDKMRSFAKIMEICAGYLTLSGAIEPKKPSFAFSAKRYILEHFHERIVIKDICDALKCSKSTLSNAFLAAYGTTINAYITDVRLKEAARLLLTTDKSFYEISSELGFSEQSYFSKVFSSKYGISPGKYKKLNKHE